MNLTANITIDNSEEYKKELAERKKQILLALGMEMRRYAVDEITEAIYDTPTSASGYVRTGALRNSIAHNENDKEGWVEVGSALEYAPPNELGSSKMKARPFLRPAVTRDEYVTNYMAIVEAALKA